jgi:transposase
MGQPSYSIDLRERVVADVKEGASRREAAERFKVSVSSAIRWAKLHDLTGGVRPRSRGGRPRSPLASHAPWLLDLIAGEPDSTLDEIVVRITGDLGVTTSRSSVDRFYRRQGISFKKNGARRRTGTSGCEGRPGGLEGKPTQS